MKLVRAVLHEMRTKSTELAEWFLAFQAILCGLWMLLPGDVFAPWTLMHVLPEWVTGPLLITHGVGAVMALRSGDVHFCRRSAGASAAIWSAFFVLFLFTPPATQFTLPLVFGLIVLSVWVYLRLYVRWPPAKRRRRA